VKLIKTFLFFVILCSTHVFSQSFFDSIKDGKFSGYFQLSYEYSDFDDAEGLKPAKGLTLRSRIAFKTAEYNGFSFYIQGHNVSYAIDDFRYPGGGNPEYDVIADPDGSRIHQMYFDLKMFSNSKLRVGRQEILLDDVRLIGNVGWRQNGQSFDAVTFTNTTNKNKLTLSYINQVNTIFLTSVDLDSLILINNTYKTGKDSFVTAFAYLLDTESTEPTSRDCGTYGLRVVDRLFDMKLDVTYAIQEDYADGEGHGGDMWNVLLTDKFIGGTTFGLGLNRISGQNNNDRPFDTLYSTAHKYNGWADQFLATNGGTLVNGLLDIYAQIKGKAMGGSWTLVYHDFDTTETGQGFEEKYGTEFDGVFVKKINKNLKYLLKFAKYNAKSYADAINPTHDETVYWGRIIYTF